MGTGQLPHALVKEINNIPSSGIPYVLGEAAELSVIKETLNDLNDSLSSIIDVVDVNVEENDYVESVGHIGDSLTTGSNYAPGGPRTVFFGKSRKIHSNLVAWGPVQAGLSQSISLFDLRCAGYPGETIQNINTRLQPGGSIYNYAELNSVPKLLFWMIGTNDLYAGTTPSDALSYYRSMLDSAIALFPNTKHIIQTIPKFYSPAAPVGGLVLVNSNIDEFNSGLYALARNYNNVSVLDTSSKIPQSSYAPDGVHLSFEGQAIIGNLQANEYNRLFPIGRGDQAPRSLTLRTSEPCFNILTSTTDNATVTDSGFELPAESFCLTLELRVTSFSTGTNAIAQCTPNGQNYTKGWLLAYDGTNNTLNLYIKNDAYTAQIPSDAFDGRPLIISVYANREKQIVSFYLSYIPSGGVDPQIGCIGMNLNATQWTAGDVNGELVVGKNASYSSVTGQVRRLEFSKGSNLPSIDKFITYLEAKVFEGVPIPGLSGLASLTEGTGTVFTTGNLVAGVCTETWTSAGIIPWFYEEKGGSGILLSDNMTEWDFALDQRFKLSLNASLGITKDAGNAISSWSSMIGLITAVQAVAPNKPLYSSNGVNGRPGVSFDGLASFLSLNKGGAAIGTEGISPLCDQLIIAVIKPSGAFASGRWLLDINNGRTIAAVNESSVGNFISYYGVGWSSSGVVSTTNLQILAWEYKASVGTRMFRNGTQIGATDAVNSTPTALGGASAIGSNNGGTASFYQGLIGALCIATGNIDDKLRKKSTRKLANMFGITVS